MQLAIHDTHSQIVEHGPVHNAVRLIGSSEAPEDLEVQSEVLTHTVLKHIYIYIYAAK